MAKRTHKKKRRNARAFTIIEVMVVLAIAGLILLIVFMAVPAAQRSFRNRGRYNDAARLAQAVNECLVANNNQTTSCDETSEIPLNVSDFSVASGFHYGSHDTHYSSPYPPTIDEPNWLFGAQCNSLGNFLITGIMKQFVVGLYLESGDPNSPTPRCIDGA